MNVASACHLFAGIYLSKIINLKFPSNNTNAMLSHLDPSVRSREGTKMK